MPPPPKPAKLDLANAARRSPAVSPSTKALSPAAKRLDPQLLKLSGGAVAQEEATYDKPLDPQSIRGMVICCATSVIERLQVLQQVLEYRLPSTHELIGVESRAAVEEVQKIFDDVLNGIPEDDFGVDTSAASDLDDLHHIIGALRHRILNEKVAHRATQQLVDTLKAKAVRREESFTYVKNELQKDISTLRRAVSGNLAQLPDPDGVFSTLDMMLLITNSDADANVAQMLQDLMSLLKDEEMQKRVQESNFIGSMRKIQELREANEKLERQMKALSQRAQDEVAKMKVKLVKAERNQNTLLSRVGTLEHENGELSRRLNEELESNSVLRADNDAMAQQIFMHEEILTREKSHLMVQLASLSVRLHAEQQKQRKKWTVDPDALDAEFAKLINMSGKIPDGMKSSEVVERLLRLVNRENDPRKVATIEAMKERLVYLAKEVELWKEESIQTAVERNQASSRTVELEEDITRIQGFAHDNELELTNLAVARNEASHCDTLSLDFDYRPIIRTYRADTSIATRRLRTLKERLDITLKQTKIMSDKEAAVAKAAEQERQRLAAENSDSDSEENQQDGQELGTSEALIEAVEKMEMFMVSMKDRVTTDASEIRALMAANEIEKHAQEKERELWLKEWTALMAQLPPALAAKIDSSGVKVLKDVRVQRILQEIGANAERWMEAQVEEIIEEASVGSDDENDAENISDHLTSSASASGSFIADVANKQYAMHEKPKPEKKPKPEVKLDATPKRRKSLAPPSDSNEQSMSSDSSKLGAKKKSAVSLKAGSKKSPAGKKGSSSISPIPGGEDSIVDSESQSMRDDDTALIPSTGITGFPMIRFDAECQTYTNTIEKGTQFVIDSPNSTELNTKSPKSDALTHSVGCSTDPPKTSYKALQTDITPASQSSVPIAEKSIQTTFDSPFDGNAAGKLLTDLGQMLKNTNGTLSAKTPPAKSIVARIDDVRKKDSVLCPHCGEYSGPDGAKIAPRRNSLPQQGIATRSENQPAVGAQPHEARNPLHPDDTPFRSPEDSPSLSPRSTSPESAPSAHSRTSPTQEIQNEISSPRSVVAVDPISGHEVVVAVAVSTQTLPAYPVYRNGGGFAPPPQISTATQPSPTLAASATLATSTSTNTGTPLRLEATAILGRSGSPVGVGGATLSSFDGTLRSSSDSMHDSTMSEVHSLGGHFPVSTPHGDGHAVASAGSNIDSEPFLQPQTSIADSIPAPPAAVTTLRPSSSQSDIPSAKHSARAACGPGSPSMFDSYARRTSETSSDVSKKEVLLPTVIKPPRMSSAGSFGTPHSQPLRSPTSPLSATFAPLLDAVVQTVAELCDRDELVELQAKVAELEHLLVSTANRVQQRLNTPSDGESRVRLGYSTSAGPTDVHSLPLFADFRGRSSRPPLAPNSRGGTPQRQPPQGSLAGLGSPLPPLFHRSGTSTINDGHSRPDVLDIATGESLYPEYDDPKDGLMDDAFAGKDINLAEYLRRGKGMKKQVTIRPAKGFQHREGDAGELSQKAQILRRSLSPPHPMFHCPPNRVQTVASITPSRQAPYGTRIEPLSPDGTRGNVRSPPRSLTTPFGGKPSPSKRANSLPTTANTTSPPLAQYRPKDPAAMSPHEVERLRKEIVRGGVTIPGFVKKRSS